MLFVPKCYRQTDGQMDRLIAFLLHGGELKDKFNSHHTVLHKNKYMYSVMYIYIDVYVDVTEKNKH